MRTIVKDLPDKALVSYRLAQRLHALDCWSTAKVVYGFSPMASEPDWRTGNVDHRIVAYPRVEGDALLFYITGKFVKNALGAFEPLGGELAPPPDIVLVPGLAFDPAGHRLGRGRGFYDRWLEQQEHSMAIGIAFACQMIPAVPREAHDVRVDGILTENGYLDCRSR